MPLGQRIERDGQSGVEDGGSQPAALRPEVTGLRVGAPRAEQERGENQDVNSEVGRAQGDQPDDAHQEEAGRGKGRAAQAPSSGAVPPAVPPPAHALAQGRQLAYERQGLTQHIARADDQQYDDDSTGDGGGFPAQEGARAPDGGEDGRARPSLPIRGGGGVGVGRRHAVRQWAGWRANRVQARRRSTVGHTVRHGARCRQALR